MLKLEFSIILHEKNNICALLDILMHYIYL